MRLEETRCVHKHNEPLIYNMLFSGNCAKQQCERQEQSTRRRRTLKCIFSYDLVSRSEWSARVFFYLPQVDIQRECIVDFSN